MNSIQFGGKLTPHLINQYAQSPNWYQGRFENLETTTMNVNLWTMPKLIYQQFRGRTQRAPAKPIPVLDFDRQNFLAPGENIKLIWYGHSAILLKIGPHIIFIDPMLGPDASPIAPIPTKRFSLDTLDLISALPQIDLVLISHDHYDHLDYESIQRLKSKTKYFLVALGVQRHLERWGIEPSRIKEFDWWDAFNLGELSITFTPTRHFSGRGVTDRARSLWGGWAIHSPYGRVWFSGDGGYGSHFKTIGEKLGPFDFAMMECGQYNALWHLIHLSPEETVRAAQDAQAKTIMPVHWAGFLLAPHHWLDPINRFTAAAHAQSQDYVTPSIGQMFSIAEPLQNTWWEDWR